MAEKRCQVENCTNKCSDVEDIPLNVLRNFARPEWVRLCASCIDKYQNALKDNLKLHSLPLTVELIDIVGSTEPIPGLSSQPKTMEFHEEMELSSTSQQKKYENQKGVANDNTSVVDYSLFPHHFAQPRKLVINKLNCKILNRISFDEVWDLVDGCGHRVDEITLDVNINIIMIARKFQFRTRFDTVKSLEIPFANVERYTSFVKKRILPQFPELETLTFLEIKRKHHADVEWEDWRRFHFVRGQIYQRVCPKLKWIFVNSQVAGSFKIKLGKRTAA
ncbi:unnamed protein product [Orchesella dallaii]|uniref:Uncharacterized protein n=1 Tax=Orchesella dallaii TaxID=48710 RepID=A0ABP1QZ80_9HEXA